MTISMDLQRLFYEEGGFIPSPPNSLYYTLGTTTPVTTPGWTGMGLYDPVDLTESDVAGLYNIPLSGREDSTTNIVDYSAAEDGTTLNPANFNGGSGQVTVQTIDFGRPEEYFTGNLTLKDTLNGSISAIIRGVDDTDGQVGFTADALPALFNVEGILPPTHTSLQGTITQYINSLGISIPIRFEDGLGSRQVVYPSWEGNVWDAIKQIGAAEQIEFAFMGTTLIVRKPRKTTIDNAQQTTLTRSINAQDVSKQVRVHFYNTQYMRGQEVYPVKDSPFTIKTTEEYVKEPANVYTVDAAQTVKFTVDVNASLEYVNQPSYLAFVEDKDYSGTSGRYTAAGADGKPITPSFWEGNGGKLSVRLLDNKRQIEVTIVGPADMTYAPYSIAMTAGEGEYYNALHITGGGNFESDDFIDLRTGATSQTTTEEIGLEVTNPFIRTKSQAYTVGMYASASKALSYTVTSDGFQFMPGTVAFGKIGGAMMNAHDSRFRIDSANVSPAQMSLTASLDVIVKDVNDNYAGMTMGEVSALWESRTMLDFSIAPLKPTN